MREGTKHDEGKPDLTYLSYEMLCGVSRVRDFGAKKYSKDNWKQGFKISRSCAAALRHIYQYLQVEDNDRESGECHLFHAICCLEHAAFDHLHRPENDDRVFSKSFVEKGDEYENPNDPACCGAVRGGGES